VTSDDRLTKPEDGEFRLVALAGFGVGQGRRVS